MTGTERIDRLPELLSELAAPRRPDYTDDILARTAGQRQRPARTFLERILPMSETTLPGTRTMPPPVRTFALVLLLAALAVALASAAFIASRPSAPLPAPFGPAANGAIPYVSGGDLYLGDLATGTSRLIVGGPYADALPQFSPDGTKLAFIRDVGTGAGPLPIDVWVVAADGSDPQRINPSPIDDWRWITWTPDGGRIAVVHMVDGTGQLDLFDASGNGSVQRIAAAAGLDSLQFRPPDGREILFRAGVDDMTAGTTIKPKMYSLYAMDADGTNVRKLAEPATKNDTMDLTGAVYSGDGSRIFYNRWTSDASFGEPGCCQLFVMNADGSDEHKFIPNTGDTWDGAAVVSPDGTRIAFWHNLPDRPTHGISVIRADGTGPIIETGPQLSGTAHWVWAPDSSKILMYPNDVPSTSAYLLDPAGGPWTTVPWRSDGDLDWQRLALAP